MTPALYDVPVVGLYEQSQRVPQDDLLEYLPAPRPFTWSSGAHWRPIRREDGWTIATRKHMSRGDWVLVCVLSAGMTALLVYVARLIAQFNGWPFWIPPAMGVVLLLVVWLAIWAAIAKARDAERLRPDLAAWRDGGDVLELPRSEMTLPLVSLLAIEIACVSQTGRGYFGREWTTDHLVLHFRDQDGVACHFPLAMGEHGLTQVGRCLADELGIRVIWTRRSVKAPDGWELPRNYGD